MYQEFWKPWNVIKDEDGCLILTQEETTFSVIV